MGITNLIRRDCLAGLFFIAIGAAALVIGHGYRVGTLLSMGPGYFPRAISMLLLLLGALVLIAGLRSSGATPMERWHWRPLLLILLGVVLFGASLERFGLVAATALMIVSACRAEKDRGWTEIVLLAVALNAIGWGIFVEGLGLPIPLWPPAVTG